MLVRPAISDFRTILYYVGRLVVGIGLLMCVPLLVALLSGEFEVLPDFIIGIAAAVIFGSLLSFGAHTTHDLSWAQGMVVVAMGWFFSMLFSAVPMYLSGHFLSFLDAFFDSVSGYTTSGLTLLQDLDHLPNAHNMWRHFIMFIGGQGIAVMALTFMVVLKGSGGAFEMYVGEAREERIMPHIKQTSRFIWLVSLVYLLLGTGALTLAMVLEGMPAVRGFLHSMWIFMAGFDTGGFAPQSSNILYYHSAAVEMFTIFFMVLGTMNFALHYALWNGRSREIWKNIETISLFVTIALTTFVAYLGLSEVYPEAMSLFRKAFYHIISAHSGTGFMTIYAPQYPSEWTSLSIFAIILAMALGGSSCSTAGGIKALRIGIAVKSLFLELKRFLLPESAVVISRYHHIKDVILTDKTIKLSFLIMVGYVFIYFVGAAIGMYYGVPFDQALFESTSAAANVGLSNGTTSPDMPALLKITYAFQMFVGRLEFLAVIVFFGMVYAAVRGK